MAALGHLAVGLVAGRAHRRGRPAAAMALLVALSYLADLDAVGLRLGVPYAAPFGHRGAMHSLAFALVVSLVVLAVEAARGRPALGIFGWALLVMATHPLLDAATDGGMGVALFWPLSDERVFLPWRFLPVAPIGPGIFSARGLHVVLVELAWSALLLGWALWPRGADARARAA